MQNQNTTYEFQDDSNYGSPGKGRVVMIVIASVAIISALLVGLFFFMDATQYKGGDALGGALGQLEGKTAEEIQQALDDFVEEGTLNISIASVIRFPDGNSEGELRIENAPSNRYLMQVDIARNDNGTVIYSSDPIEPNYHVQYGKLKTPLPKGDYECTATFYALNMETREVAGQAGAAVTVVVEK